MTNDLSSFLNVRMQILMSFIILLQNNNKNTNMQENTKKENSYSKSCHPEIMLFLSI